MKSLYSNGIENFTFSSIVKKFFYRLYLIFFIPAYIVVSNVLTSIL